MKKQILLLVSITFSFIAFSQQPSFGIRAGIVNSSIKGDAEKSLQEIIDVTDGIITTNSRTGFFAGAFVSIPVSSIVSIEPGLYYSQKGYEMRGALDLKGVEFLGINATARLNAQYIDVPVVVKMNMGGLQVFAGPQLSYLANSELVAKAGLLGFNLLNKTMDATDQLNRWDAGITGGIGYKFSNGLNISAAYDHGLMRADVNENLEAYNRAFKVGIGLEF